MGKFPITCTSKRNILTDYRESSLKEYIRNSKASHCLMVMHVTKTELPYGTSLYICPLTNILISHLDPAQTTTFLLTKFQTHIESIGIIKYVDKQRRPRSDCKYIHADWGIASDKKFFNKKKMLHESIHCGFTMSSQNMLLWRNKKNNFQGPVVKN